WRRRLTASPSAPSPRRAPPPMAGSIAAILPACCSCWASRASSGCGSRILRKALRKVRRPREGGDAGSFGLLIPAQVARVQSVLHPVAEERLVGLAQRIQRHV